MAGSVPQQLKARLLALSPRAFELLSGDLLEFVGLQDVAVTRYVGDGGIDATGNLRLYDNLLQVSVGVQVKRYRNNVQRADIDRFIGAINGRYAQGMFITTGGYAATALQRAQQSIPPIAPLNGDQVVHLMLRHQLGIHDGVRFDENYFEQFEIQAAATGKQIGDSRAPYTTDNGGRSADPREDLISLRALSHALRVDTTTLRRYIDRGELRPDTAPSYKGGGFFFRRDRIAALRATLIGSALPRDPAAWRREFLAFVGSRTMTKSYKPVLLNALLDLVDEQGEAPLDAIVRHMRNFYEARRTAGLPVEFGTPQPDRLSDLQLRQLIVRHPLERFLIKGFLQYETQTGIVRFSPYLWQELRHWEWRMIRRAAAEQLAYYYNRGDTTP